jgi:hypothetical protein
VLLDAMIIIEAHGVDVWDRLLEEVNVLVPATVINNEAFYFDSKKTNRRGAIRLRQSVELGKISEVNATIEDLQSLHEILSFSTLQGLHEGELEALAALHGGTAKGALFCTAEGAAIRALALLGHSESGISFEILLREVGLQKALEDHYSDKFFRFHLERGKQDRITGTGLRKSPF